MATQPPTPTPKEFTINLNILANGDIDASGPHQKGMSVGDTAKFVPSNPGNVASLVLEFQSEPAVDKNGRAVPANLLPFGVVKLENPDASTPFTVVNSCKAWMLVAITTKDGRLHHCAWDVANSISGTRICTGGGGSPVAC